MVLKTLGVLGPLRGYGITCRIKQIIERFFAAQAEDLT
jgi:hypothetical protein